jgi:hypothetical protein
MEREMIEYLNKTEKHLFTRKGFMQFKPNAHKYQGYMFKIFPLTINGKFYRVRVEFNDLNTNVYINEVISNNKNKNSFNIMKTNLFPHFTDEDRKTKSIRTFKGVKDMMKEVKSTDFKSVSEANSKIKEIFTLKNYDNVKV